MGRAEIGELALAGRSSDELRRLDAILVILQRGLFVAGSELAANPEAWDRLEDRVTRVDETMLQELETALAEYESRITMPREFVVPGASRLSAALELARTILRRAERRAVTLRRDGRVPGEWLLPYLNRQADLVWVLARAAEQAEERVTVFAREGRARPLRRSAANAGDPSKERLDEHR